MSSQYTIERLLEHLPNEDAPYFESLGRFITAYAQAEAEIHQLARRLIGTTDAKARILIRGMRLGDVNHRVRQLLLLKKASAKYREIDACLTQLDVVAKQRDKLVHQHVSYSGKALRATNRRTAKSGALIEQTTFNQVDLINMEADCRVIAVRLTLARLPVLRNRIKREDKHLIMQPWRYKPPKPVPRAK